VRFALLFCFNALHTCEHIGSGLIHWRGVDSPKIFLGEVGVTKCLILGEQQ